MRGLLLIATWYELTLSNKFIVLTSIVTVSSPPDYQLSVYFELSDTVVRPPICPQDIPRFCSQCSSMSKVHQQHSYAAINRPFQFFTLAAPPTCKTPWHVCALISPNLSGRRNFQWLCLRTAFRWWCNACGVFRNGRLASVTLTTYHRTSTTI